MAKKNPVIVWFRNDLRLADNPALSAAVQTGDPVIPLYILDEQTAGRWKPGAASRWWLHHSLESLNHDLSGKLLLKRGKADEVLEKLVKATGARGIYWNRCYEPYAIRQESRIKSKLDAEKIHSFDANLLFDPEVIRNKEGTYYKLFTYYWKNCLKDASIIKPLEKPNLSNLLQLKGDALDEWDLLPTHPDWAVGLRKTWEPGEESALRFLKKFKQRLPDYEKQRDYPARNATSRLSPYLHFGEISPRTIWHAMPKKGAEPFLRQLGWREFSYYLLYHFPKLPTEPFQDSFKDFPWEKQRSHLKAWQNGMTGYPIVDAGMRQLWQTGWMHNRVRMITASFLTKDLLIPWQKGEEWFWDTLVDADLANNSAGWQWVAGCGADAAPYYRIFNPVLQGEKFDPEGDYLKKWVPELKDLPKKYIHKPWDAPKEMIALGKEYPHPIVDHAEARDKALKTFDILRRRKRR